MKFIYALLVFLSLPATAEICLTTPETYPRQDVSLRETYIRIMPHPTLGGSAIVLGWPKLIPGQISCVVSHFDTGAYATMLAGSQRTTAIPVSAFAAGLPALPWSDRAMENPWAVNACQEMVDTMTADGVVNPYRVVRSPIRDDGARPMFTLVNDALVNLRVNGEPVYVEPGRICENTPVVGIRTAGVFLYVTNFAGVRGIALCSL